MLCTMHLLLLLVITPTPVVAGRIAEMDKRTRQAMPSSPRARHVATLRTRGVPTGDVSAGGTRRQAT